MCSFPKIWYGSRVTPRVSEKLKGGMTQTDWVILDQLHCRRLQPQMSESCKLNASNCPPSQFRTSTVSLHAARLATRSGLTMLSASRRKLLEDIDDPFFFSKEQQDEVPGGKPLVPGSRDGGEHCQRTEHTTVRSVSPQKDAKSDNENRLQRIDSLVSSALTD